MNWTVQYQTKELQTSYDKLPPYNTILIQHGIRKNDLTKSKLKGLY